MTSQRPHEANEIRHRNQFKLDNLSDFLLSLKYNTR